MVDDHQRDHHVANEPGRRVGDREIKVEDLTVGQDPCGDLLHEDRAHPLRRLHEEDAPDRHGEMLCEQARPRAIVEEAGGCPERDMGRDELCGDPCSSDAMRGVFPRAGTIVEEYGGPLSLLHRNHRFAAPASHARGL